MAKTTSDKPSESAEEALKRPKQQVKREAKLMLEIEDAKKDLKRAQKNQSKARAWLEVLRTTLDRLEAEQAEMRSPNRVPSIETPPDSAGLERQQASSELDSGIAHSDGNQQASPETGTSALTDEEQHAPVAEETTPSEAVVVTNDVTERSEGTEAAVVQDNEIATEPAPTPTTSRKVPAHKTVATRKPTVTKRPTSQSTATKRPASRSQSTRQPHADSE